MIRLTSPPGMRNAWNVVVTELGKGVALTLYSKCQESEVTPKGR